MGVITWNDVMALDLDDVVSKDVTDLYNALLEFDPDDEADTTRLKKLFRVTQAVLTVKGVEAEQVLDQLAKEAAEGGRKAAQKNQEIENLKVEVQTLKKKNRDLEQLRGSSGTNWKDQNLRETVEELESQITSLHKDLQEYKIKLQEEKDISEKYRLQSEEFERKVREMKIDNDQLREDLRDIQRQSDAQRESLLNKMDSDQQMNEKIKSKNILLNNALDENRKLSEYNMELEKQIEKLKAEMIDGKNEVDKTTEDYLKLKVLVGMSEGEIDRYVRENAALKLQIEELLGKLKIKNTDEDELMMQVRYRVEEWKLILSEKDDKIKDLQCQILKLKDEIMIINVDADKASVTELRKMLREKDEEISVLMEKLKEATDEMEHRASFMDDIKLKLLRGSNNEMKQNLERMIEKLENHLKEKNEMIQNLELRIQTAESDAIAKDRELNEAYSKMTLYEQSIYGLPEAVSEIKQLEAKLNERDRTVEELTQYINRCEEQLNGLYEETEDLRERLGLDPKLPLCIEGITHRRGLNIMKDKSLNRILQKEIERLEDERLLLKNQIREMSQTTGQRAAILGLSLEHMELVNSFIDDLKVKSDSQIRDNILSSISKKGDIVYREKYSSEELEKKSKKLNILYEENTELKSKLSDLETENKLLEKAIKEIREQITAENFKGGLMNSEALDKVIEVMDCRSIIGRHDKAVILKAQLDNLKGHNEELRREIKEVKIEASKSQDAISKLTAKNMSMEMELKSYKDNGLKGPLQYLKLPMSLDPSSSEIINCLNEHLLITLQDLSVKKDLLKTCEENFEILKKKFAVAVHKQGLIYDQIAELKKNNDLEVENLKQELQKKQEIIEADAIKIQEFDRLLETMGKDDDEIKQRLAETCRQICVLRTNEQTLCRKFSMIWNSESLLRREISRLKMESMDMEKNVTEKIGYLQRTKDSAVFKLSVVQKLLESSVPAADLDVANKQFSELTEKYRALLEATNSLVEHKTESDSSKEELKSLKQCNENLMKELSLSKEKINVYEFSLQRFQEAKDNKGEGIEGNEANDNILAKRMATLEVKELHERQRAEHATVMYEQQKKQLRMAEERISEMESKFAELTQMNLEMQKLERELREELANSVSLSMSEADKNKICSLEASEINSKQEIDRLKEISEVALMQVHSMELIKLATDNEVTSLRQQLLDIQAQNDERTITSKLHSQIVHLQLRENLAQKKSEKLTRKCEILEAKALRIEQKLDEKEAEQIHSRREYSNRMKHLKTIIKEYRRRYAGSVPLAEQEKFTKLLLKLQDDKLKTGIELAKAEEERWKIEEKLLELQTEQEGMKKLCSTLKDGKGAEKVSEWHKRMQDVRIEGLKLKRENEALKQKMTFMEGLTKKLEADVKFLEEDKIRLTQEFEDSEIEWEHREVELERTVQMLEAQLSCYGKTSLEYIKELDQNLPLSEQVEQSQVMIRDKEVKLKDAQSLNAGLSKRVENLDIKLREKEAELLRRERVIAELRLRIPALFENQLEKSNDLENLPGLQFNKRDEKFVQVTKQALQDLQERLNQKEETLLKYRKLLEESQHDLKQSSARHEKEIKILEEQLQAKHDSNLIEIKKAINDSLSRSDMINLTGPQIRRIGEFEELLAEQEVVVCSLQDYLSEAKKEVQDLMLKYEKKEIECENQLKQLKDKCQDEVERLKLQNAELEKSMEELKVELNDVKRRSSILKQSQEQDKYERSPAEAVPTFQENDSSSPPRTPGMIMKKTIEGLKHEIAFKDQKIKTMSKALIDLRTEMSNKASMEAHLSSETNLRKSLDAKALNEKIEELTQKLKKCKETNKSLKERNLELSDEMKITQDSLCRKDILLKRYQQERDKFSFEVEELKKKIERMNTMSKQRPETEGFYQELDDLRRKNKLLIEELERLKIRPEKPYELDHSSRDKLEKKCEDLKVQLREKDAELMRLNSVNNMLKTASYREKENQEVLHKERIRYTMSKKEGPPPMFGELQELRRQNNSLNDKISSLRQEKDTINRNLEEVQSHNLKLRESLSQFEKKRNAVSTSIPEKTPDYKDLRQRENDLKKRVIELSEKNLQLNFELEQANRDIPRLKEKLDDQKKYIEILKAEKKQREMISRSRESLSSFGSQSSSIKKIGESGRSSKELEKIIYVLKKVIDKKQLENDELKPRLKDVEALLKKRESELEQLKKEHESCGQNTTPGGNAHNKKIDSLERELSLKERRIKELQDMFLQARRD